MTPDHLHVSEVVLRRLSVKEDHRSVDLPVPIADVERRLGLVD